jgi:hypothetical protein
MAGACAQSTEAQAAIQLLDHGDGLNGNIEQAMPTSSLHTVIGVQPPHLRSDPCKQHGEAISPAS